jgi:hypothetical protein
VTPVSGALPSSVWMTIHDLDIDVHHDAENVLLCLLDSSGNFTITTNSGEEIRIRRTPPRFAAQRRRWPLGRTP